MINVLRRLAVLSALAMLLTPNQSSSAVESQAALTTSTEAEKPVDPVDIDEEKTAKQVKLIIRVEVPHNKQPVDKFDIYPYPVEPAKIRNSSSALTTEPTAIKDALYTLGYTARTAIEDPYPAYGWRMQYAFKAAMRKSKLAFPHGLLEVNPWRQEIRPYLLEEILKSNAFERQRAARYAAAVEEFKETRTETEIEALRQGLFPIYVYVRRGRGIQREGYALVDPATWWVVGTHKVAGLSYYWQQRVKLTDAPEQVVNLNEDNALFIEGGW